MQLQDHRGSHIFRTNSIRQRPSRHHWTRIKGTLLSLGGKQQRTLRVRTSLRQRESVVCLISFRGEQTCTRGAKRGGMDTTARSFLMAVVFLSCASASWPTMEGARPCLGKGCRQVPQRSVKPQRQAPPAAPRKSAQVSEPVMSVFGVGEAAASGGTAAVRKSSPSRNKSKNSKNESLRKALQGAGLQ